MPHSSARIINEDYVYYGTAYQNPRCMESCTIPYVGGAIIVLRNKHTGEVIGEIEGNIVKTAIGTYQVGEYDRRWLVNEAGKLRHFTALDVRAVGELISPDEAI
jgi:hypothetical protein